MGFVEDIIERLGLEPHPREGGYFRETYRSRELVARKALPDRYRGEHAFATCIYYLLTPDTCSALHRLQSDEIFHFYLGDPVEMLQLTPDGRGTLITLGSEVTKGLYPQVVVPRGVWQGSSLVPGGKYALLGCTVAPGFDFSDYEDADRGELLEQFPDFGAKILALTPGQA